MAVLLFQTPEIMLAEVESEDIAEAQRVFDETSRYHRLLLGGPADEDMARRCFEHSPPKPRHSLRVWKYMIGIFPQDSEEMIGLLDIFVGFPRYDLATLATFMLKESYQRKGWGGFAIEGMSAWLKKRHPAVDCIDASVTDDNIPGTRFLLKHGFQRTNTWNQVEVGGVSKRIIRLERLLK